MTGERPDEPQIPPGSSGEEPRAPEAPDRRDRPRIGVDEWVAQVEERREERGVLGRAGRAADRVPDPAKALVFVGIAAIVPFVLGSGDLFRFGVFTLLYAILAQGLNVVVGYAGLLDLGYVAFFGFGAYTYAVISSEHVDLRWPSEVALLIAIAATAVLGLLLGLPSWRLLGDYLAIVTLFFGQAFVTFVNNANPRGISGGSGGIAAIDPLEIFGFRLTSIRDYYFFSLVALVVVMAAVWSLAHSRVGRAWQALREDPLAAELMGTPVNRLKLAAFALGASIAGLAGGIFAALATAVAPGAFDISLIILIYAMVILGGMGSITGVLVGAILVNVSFEILTPATPETARVLFYVALIACVALAIRPWPRALIALAGTAVFGLVVHAVAERAWPERTSGQVEEGGALGDAIDSWVVLASGGGRLPQYAYVALVVCVIALVNLRGWWRVALLPPILYLTVFVWENLLIQEPAVTRFVLFGALLIVLMQARPQGLFGTARVEIV